MLKNNQEKELIELLGRGLVKIRELGWAGKSDQAADLADALHGLPYDLIHDNFSFDRIKMNLGIYTKKHPPKVEGGYTDFLSIIKQIEQL